MSQARNRTVVIGAFPPPTNGYSAITSAFTELLSETHVIARFDISPGRAVRDVRYHARRTLRTVYAIFGLIGRRFVGYRDVYLAVESGYGLIYTIAICAAARILGMRIYMHHHSFRYILKRSALMQFVQTLARGCGSHIFLCDCMARDFSSLYGSGVRQVTLSNMAFVQPDNDEDVPLKAGRPMTIGHLSNLTREKGLYHFLALAEAAKKQGLPWRFLLAGPAYDSLDRRAIDDACQKLGAVIEYRGSLYGAGKQEFYCDIDVFAFPSEYVNEAQPLVVFEALSAGALVVAYNRGCIAEQIANDGKVIEQGSDFAVEAVEWLQTLAIDRPNLDRRRAAARARMQRDHREARTQVPGIFSPGWTGLHRPDLPVQTRVGQATYDILRRAAGELLFALDGSPFLSDAETAATSRPGTVVDRIARVSIARFPRKMLDRGVVFVHIPKNAGTSVNEALYGRSFGHLTAQYLQRLDPEKFRSLASFAILRDPVQRAISAYFHVIRAGGDAVRMHPFWRRRLAYIRTFDDFIAYLETHRDELDRLEFVVRPQSTFVCDPEGGLLVRDVFVLGEDERLLTGYLARYGVSELPYRNKTARLAVSVTEAHRAILNKLYARDLALIARVRGSRPATREAEATWQTATS